MILSMLSASLSTGPEIGQHLLGCAKQRDLVRVVDGKHGGSGNQLIARARQTEALHVSVKRKNMTEVMLSLRVIDNNVD